MCARPECGQCRMWGKTELSLLLCSPNTRLCCWLWLWICWEEFTRVDLHVKPRCEWMMFYLPLSLPQKGSEQMISCTCDHAFTVASIFWTSSTSCHPWGHDLGQSRLTASTQYPLLSNWPPSDFDAVFSLRSVSSCVHSHQAPKSNRAESCFTWWHPPGIWVPSPGKLLSPLSPWLTQPWAD